MAYIDKIYSTTWEEYKELIDWAKDKVVSGSYGKKKFSYKVIDYIRKYTEEEFVTDLVIMNNPYWLDVYLWQNCPVQFVLDRLVFQYKDLSNVKLFTLPDDFKQNRSVQIVRTKNTVYPLTLYNYFWVQTKNDKGFRLYYNDKLQAWTPHESGFHGNTNTMHGTSLRRIIRQLKKMYLPSGITFTLSGRYVGESYLIKIK